MKHKSLIPLFLVIIFMHIACSRISSTFIDDFEQTSDNWRYGSEILSRRDGPLTLYYYYYQITLSGTALHPDNMKTFTASVQLEFTENGKQTLTMGWGKPYEWSSIGDCLAAIDIDHTGRAVFREGEKVLGEVQLPAADNERTFDLSFTQKSDRIVVHSNEEEDISFSLDGVSRPGYLMFTAKDTESPMQSWKVHLKRVEINHLGKRAPLTEEKRNKEIQTWAKVQLAKNDARMNLFEEFIKTETLAGRWGFKTNMSVSPGLVKQGEKVTVNFQIEGAIPEPCNVYVEADYLSATPGAPQTMSIDWKLEQDGNHTAAITLNPQETGTWRITWQAGDEKLSRIFAVIGPGYTVCRLLITNHVGPWREGRGPESYDVIHEYDLTADFWSCDEWSSAFARTPEDLLNHYRFFSRNRHRWGDRVYPLANANWIIPSSPDFNLWKFDEEVQRIGIQQLQRMWGLLGLGNLDILGSYTFSHSTTAIARDLGVKVLDSFCPWQNWRDGGSDNHWLINHVGMPIVPYYVADDDFRKVAAGRSIIAVPQYTGSDVRLYDIMTAEGQPQLNFRRAFSREMAERSNIDRFETTVDLWMKAAAYQTEPLFVSIGLENFFDFRDWDEANTLGVRYLRERAKHEKLVFVSSVDIADYFERHYPVQPENWIVWPDVYAGQSGWFKPRYLLDRIEVSNVRFHTVHEDGNILPKFFWDYTIPWSDPEWDDQAEIRLKHGLVDPEILTSENMIPSMVCLDGVTVEVAQKLKDDEIEITFTINAPQAIKTLPLAAWRIPVKPENQTVTFASPDTRYLSVVDGSTGNPHALVVCDNLPMGTSTRTVRVQGPSLEIIEPNLKIGEHICGRMFLRNFGPQIYLWKAENKTPNGALKINLPARREASVQYNDGRVVKSVNGKLTVEFDQTWQKTSPRILGLSALELQAFSVFEPF